MTTDAVVHQDAYTLWTQLEAEFDRYHAVIAVLPLNQAKLQEDLRRYLCLRCAGFLERIVYVCVHLYLDECSGGPAREFSKSFFSNSPNLNSETLSKLIGRFGRDHSDRLDTFLNGTLRDSLNDLASIRNPIAHGQVPGGQKLDPERYRILCRAIYRWMTSELVTPVGTITSYN